MLFQTNSSSLRALCLAWGSVPLGWRWEGVRLSRKALGFGRSPCIFGSFSLASASGGLYTIYYPHRCVEPKFLEGACLLELEIIGALRSFCFFCFLGKEHIPKLENGGIGFRFSGWRRRKVNPPIPPPKEGLPSEDKMNSPWFKNLYRPPISAISAPYWRRMSALLSLSALVLHSPGAPS